MEDGRWKEEREEDRGKEGRQKDWVKTRLNQVRERERKRERGREGGRLDEGRE